MHITIIMPAFNVADYIGDAMKSVMVQSHCDWSMVVVDDGSTDATVAVASEFTDQRIRVIRQRNAGVSGARNTGIAAASAPGFCTAEHDPQGGAVMFLDADDWLAPEALAHLARPLEAAPGAVACIGRFARVGPDGVVRLAPPPPKGDLLERLLTRNLFANGGHVLIRRSAVAAAGVFRPDLSYGEDWDYWVRLAVLGEFVSTCSSRPLLFVRERLTGAYLSRATDPGAYRPALEVILGYPEILNRLGRTRLQALARRAAAEMGWTLGRELIRHGQRREGLCWLGRSLCSAPAPKRLVLFGLACLRLGPFRAYRSVPSSARP